MDRVGFLFFDGSAQRLALNIDLDPAEATPMVPEGGVEPPRPLRAGGF
jgi:hypothetical protein